MWQSVSPPFLVPNPLALIHLPKPPSSLSPFIKSQSTLRPIHNTKRHLNRLSPNPPRHKPLPHLAQPRRSLNLTPIPPLRVLRPRPQHLSRRTSPRPNHSFQVDRIRLLGPDMALTADDKVLEVLGHGGVRVEAVHEPPVFARGTVVREGPVVRRGVLVEV